MSLEFAVGKRVVCVDDNWICMSPRYTRPVLGNIYTIRDIFTWGDFLPGGEVTFTFEEISNGMSIANREHSFYSWHFKPVKKTDISSFISMTNNIPKFTKHIKETKQPMRTPELV